MQMENIFEEFGQSNLNNKKSDCSLETKTAFPSLSCLAQDITDRVNSSNFFWMFFNLKCCIGFG